jgi:hypothetical protein
VIGWTEQGLCRKYHTDLWFPPVFSDERTAPESQYYEIAKMVCEQCPVISKCKHLGEDEEFGVWGGTSPQDRKTGTTKVPKKVLPSQHLDLLPAPNPQELLDIPALKAQLKPVLKRRAK